MNLITWNVWDMTNGDEWKVKAEDLDDFTRDTEWRKGWEQLTSFYDTFQEKWFFIMRNKETKTIYQIGIAE